MSNNRPIAPLKIIASRAALPENKIYSSMLDKKLKKTTGFVEKLSGIEYRFHANNHDSQVVLAANTIHQALASKHIAAKSSIDMLINASAIPIQAVPCSAAHILAESGLPDGIACFDVNASCISFITALQVAAGLLATSQYKRIAIVSADITSRGIDWNEQESSLIFGDGAACVIVEKDDGKCGIVSYTHTIYTKGIDLCEIRASGTRCNPRSGITDADFLFHMQGKSCFVWPHRLSKTSCNGSLMSRDYSLTKLEPSFRTTLAIYLLNICANVLESVPNS